MPRNNNDKGFHIEATVYTYKPTGKFDKYGREKYEKVSVETNKTKDKDMYALRARLLKKAAGKNDKFVNLERYKTIRVATTPKVKSYVEKKPDGSLTRSYYKVVPNK